MQKVLLFGGTSETAEICKLLAVKNWQVTLSCATSEELRVPETVKRITGRMAEEQIAGLIRQEEFTLIVCAVHPYAAQARDNIIRASQTAGVQVIVYLRQESDLSASDLIFAESHEEAAEKAFSFGKPVLLTTGSNNLMPYVKVAKRCGVEMYVRVLDGEVSKGKIAEAGVPQKNVIYGRGPFSVEDNMEHIRYGDCGVMVTKDGGSRGGVPQKLEAAAKCGCRVVMVKRPDFSGESLDTLEELRLAVDKISGGK